MKHKWTVYQSVNAYWPGIEAGEKTIVVFGAIDEECGVKGRGKKDAEDNAARIVECVNALAGMNPQALEAAVNAMQRFVNVCDTSSPVRLMENISACCEETRQALRNLKPETK